mmetsp:Transcript_2220/g.4998  ORF Transcript_2220/g.4998 Transcript_2220/m.4998 type:complete len:119 (-) Transcript_2220:196-552(-)
MNELVRGEVRVREGERGLVLYTRPTSCAATVDPRAAEKRVVCVNRSASPHAGLSIPLVNIAPTPFLKDAHQKAPRGTHGGACVLSLFLSLSLALKMLLRKAPSQALSILFCSGPVSNF